MLTCHKRTEVTNTIIKFELNLVNRRKTDADSKISCEFHLYLIPCNHKYLFALHLSNLECFNTFHLCLVEDIGVTKPKIKKSFSVFGSFRLQSN